jgi:hypothetical protein
MNSTEIKAKLWELDQQINHLVQIKQRLINDLIELDKVQKENDRKMQEMQKKKKTDKA